MEKITKQVIKNIEIRSFEGVLPDTRVYSIIEKLDEDEVLLHGGSNRSKEYSQIDVLKLSSLEWKSVGDISTVDPFFVFDKALSGHTANLLRDRKSIVVYGGFDGKSYSNAIFIIETGNFQFTQVDVRRNKNGDYPSSRCYHTSNLDEDCLYIFGGWNGSLTLLNDKDFNALWKFDFESKNLIY